MEGLQITVGLFLDDSGSLFSHAVLSMCGYSANRYQDTTPAHKTSRETVNCLQGHKMSLRYGGSDLHQPHLYRQNILQGESRILYK